MKILFLLKTYHDSDKYFEDKLSIFKNRNYKQINKIFCDFYCNWISDFYDKLSKDYEAEIIFVNTLDLIDALNDKTTKKNYFDYLNFIFNKFNPDILFSNTAEQKILLKINLKNSYNILWKSSKIEKKEKFQIFNFFHHVISDNEKILKQANDNSIKENFLLASIPEKLLMNKNFSTRNSKLLFSGSIGYEHGERRTLLTNLKKKKIDLEIRSRNIKNYNKYYDKVLNIFPFLRPRSTLQNISKEPLFGRDLFDYMSNFKYILNSHADFDINFAVNYRVFESLSLGCLLFTDINKKVEQYFRDEEHLVTYNSVENLFEKINFLKKNEKKAIEVSKNGYQLIKKKHTTLIRLKEFKKILNIN